MNALRNMKHKTLIFAYFLKKQLKYNYKKLNLIRISINFYIFNFIIIYNI
jgi:hypothetical protein